MACHFFLIMMEINELIGKRRSTVIFSGKPMEEDILKTVFEAARWAPSSNNQQPWRFIIGRKQDETVFAKMCSLLHPFNQVWACSASVLMLSVAETISSYNNRENKHARHDVGLAEGNLMIQAVSMGLVVHPMGGFDAEKAKDVLHIPEGFEPVIMIALGYPGNPADFPEEIRVKDARKRVRNPLDSFVFNGDWGNKIF